MSGDNTRQIADWNGPSGARWRTNQAWLDNMLAAFGDAALAAATPAAGEKVLDVGSGAGTSSLALAERVGPDGCVLGLDVSEPLIELARARTPAEAPLAFRLEDASRAQLPASAFDLLFSRFGVMFFDDPAAAFAHLRKALRPEGRLAFVCWRSAGENEWGSLPTAAVSHIVAAPPPAAPEAPGPFSFGDEGRVTRILSAAGFTDIVVAPLDHPILYGEGATDEAAVAMATEMAFQVGPMTRLLADQPEEVRARATEAVRAAFAARANKGAVTIHGAAWIVTARNGDA